jgi:hypothetical protein
VMASASSVRLWKHGVQRRVVAALNGVANARARWNHAVADGKAAGAAMANACLTAGCVVAWRAGCAACVRRRWWRIATNTTTSRFACLPRQHAASTPERRSTAAGCGCAQGTERVGPGTAGGLSQLTG